MPQPVETMTAVSVVSLAVLCVLGLRKLVRAERLHALRVVFFTVLLWVVVFFLFSLTFPGSHCPGFLLPRDEGNVYTITE